jgi:telomerase reverse transcriptase
LAAASCQDSSTLIEYLEAHKAPGRRSTVFVDSAFRQRHETSDLLQLVASHIQQNLVKVGKKFYRQKAGIPQGSVLSSMLCSYFYADLEMQMLSFLDNEDCLLLRLIDDFLLITTDQRKAVRFVQTMHSGIPEYGVTVNQRKTLVNFDLLVQGQTVAKSEPGQPFPYCGVLLNCNTLDIRRGRDKRETPTVYNSLTVEFSRTPGQTFQRKVLNAFKIQSHLMFFDTAVNSAVTTLNNLFDAFSEAATKMWAYTRCLQIARQPSPKLVITTISKLAHLAHMLLKSRTRKRRFPGYRCDISKSEVLWLAYKAFVTLLSRKQSKYGGVLTWLQAELAKLSLLKDIRKGRVTKLHLCGNV